MIIPFNIKYRPQIESGEYKVRTASGRPARIVCWDYKSQFDEPVFALITTSEGYEYGCQFREDGRYVGNNENYLVLEDGRPDPRKRCEEKVREILETTASIEKTAEALYYAAQRENYDRINAEIMRMHQEAVLAAVGNETDWLRSRIGTLVDVLAILENIKEDEK